MKQRASPSSRRHQRGAVTIVFGLMLVVLIGFAGLALDLGRLFVIKTELQNAMDACALSAASQLRPGFNTTADLTRAVAYGRVFSNGGLLGPGWTADQAASIKNYVNFQSTPVNITSEHISFSATLNGGYHTVGAANVRDDKYAQCNFPLAGLPVYFMQVLNLLPLVAPIANTQTVSAMAVAKGRGQICNVIPVGICPSPTIHEGDWLELGDGSGGPARGWFRWVKFNGESGANVVRDHLLNAGHCEIPTSLVVEQSGNMDSAQKAWNTRFGIYQASFDISTAPPDKTGYAFFNHSALPVAKRNWNVPDNNLPNVPATSPPYSARALPAYKTAETSPNFWNYTDSFTALTAHQSTDPDILNGKPGLATHGSSGTHNTLGLLNRRLVVVPTMTNCSGGAAIGTGFACALMLNPFGKVGSNDINGKIEYLGPIGPDSPCGSAIADALNMAVLVK